jgi:type III pantothenate kinase
MILAVDVGNTQTVLGLFRGEAIEGHWRVATDPTLTADELRVKIGGLLALDDLGWPDIERIVLSSVVPALTSHYEEMSVRATGQTPMTVGPGIKTGMPIRYDIGTATTLDVVDGTGAYLGGAIAPGVETSAEALFARAARLAKVDLDPPTKVIGTNTRESVQAGLLFGEAAMVDGLVRRAWGELGGECAVVATGGLAERMAPLCETVGHVDSDLTLKGLMLIYGRNV